MKKYWNIRYADKIADVVIVFPHWESEYVTTPPKHQTDFVRMMTEAGADLIIGGHPHVVQPVEQIESDNGNRSLCFHSLGNYISTQINPPSMLGNIAWVTFRKTEDNVIIDMEKTGSIPIVTHYLNDPPDSAKVYLLEDYNEELASSHGIKDWGGKALRYKDLLKLSEEVLKDSVRSAYELTGLRRKDK